MNEGTSMVSTSPEGMKAIYKELVQMYVEEYPKGDPLWVLNLRINAYLKNEWKAKEPAILDLALRQGIEIPEIEELMAKVFQEKRQFYKFHRI